MTLYQKILSVVGMLRSSINQKAAKSDLAAAFNPSKSYEQGRLVIYEGRLYRCVAPHLGSWNDSDFQLSTVDGAMAAGGGGVDQVQADWDELDDTEPSFIRNKPALARVATTGSYEDLEGKPTIPPETEIDDELNDESENPVQNKVITNNFDDVRAAINNCTQKAFVATDFSSAASYQEGQLVWYDHYLYRCTTAHPAGAWNADHFAQTTVSDAIAASGSGGGGGGSGPSPSDTSPQMDGTASPGTANTYSRSDHVHPSDTSKAAMTNLAPEFSPGVYVYGDVVSKDGLIYICSVVSHNGGWDSSHFMEIPLSRVVNASNPLQYTYGEVSSGHGFASVKAFCVNHGNQFAKGVVCIPTFLAHNGVFYIVRSIEAGEDRSQVNTGMTAIFGGYNNYNSLTIIGTLLRICVPIVGMLLLVLFPKSTTSKELQFSNTLLPSVVALGNVAFVR